ncbi:EcoKI restriction-modification system protein HsdS [archaeon BMS3Bbin16]|nr:EcoKI restriction-modification system protein HsdS [archaeon BMS3Bbin16]
MDYNEIYNHNISTYVSLINNYIINNKVGKQVQIKESIQKLPFKIPSKIQKKDYLPEGKYPIIDQGQSTIAGFTNDKSCLITINPLVIFGDHTLALKFIDFDFVQGADGVKLLLPDNRFVVKFFFYQLHSVNLPSRGYSRHYKYLLEHRIVFSFDKDLQQKIVDFLDDLKNKSTNKVYFNEEIETKIKLLQQLTLDISTIKMKSVFNSNVIKKLRQSILSEAVSGKVVPQDPDDEPASVLLEKIRAEKERLIKEKKIRKEKPLPPISEDEIPYELPKRWEWVRLGEYFNLKTGATPSTSMSEYWGGTIRWLKSGDVNLGEIYECNGRITEKGMNNSNCKILPINSVLIALNGQGKTRATSAMLRIEATCNQSIVAMVSYDTSKLIPEYLWTYLKSNYMHIRKITGHKQRRGLNMGIISNFIVPIPPLNEQKRIVEKVDGLMQLCDQLESQVKENQKNAESLMNSVLREAFEVEA